MSTLHSRTGTAVDTAPSLLTAHATTSLVGGLLIAGAFDYRNAPGTVHADFGGRRYSACARGNTITNRCTDATPARRDMMWAGVGTFGLAAVR